MEKRTKKVLFIISGSVGHFLGMKNFLEYIEPEVKKYIASHLNLSQFSNSSFKFYKLKSWPAFVNSELYLDIPLKTRIQLKANNMFFQNRKQELAKLLQSTTPDTIIIDNYNFTDALIVADLRRDSSLKVVLYQTRLSTDLNQGGNYGGSYRNNFKWLSYRNILRKQRFKNFLNNLSMPGFSDKTRIRQLLDELHFDNIKMNHYRYGLPSLTFLPEIILSGQDLSNFHADNQYYMGLGIKTSWNDSMIQDQKKIMISIGSRDLSTDIVSSYIKGIQDLVSSVNGVQFFIPEALKATVSGTAVSYYYWDTYHDHLAQSGLHITHGGINSIKDSLSYAVPMLICPLDWKSDQIHNALMFEKLGLARTWNVKKNSLEDVRMNIEKLLEDDFKDRIKEYVAADREKYPAEEVREKFMGLIDDERWAIRNW